MIQFIVWRLLKNSDDKKAEEWVNSSASTMFLKALAIDFQLKKYLFSD